MTPTARLGAAMFARLPDDVWLSRVAISGLGLTSLCHTSADGAAWSFGIVVVVGAVIGFAFPHPYRVRGFLAPTLTVGFGAALAAAVWGWHPAISAVAGGALAIPAGSYLSLRHYPLTGTFYGRLYPFAFALFVGTLPHWVKVFDEPGQPPARYDFNHLTPVLAASLGLVSVISWLRLFRPFFELASEPVLWLMYAIRGTGPGLAEFPRRGPCLVVANHACWFDPLFLAKVLPRPATAMMTSRFYDLPGLRWLMRRFGTIRVPESTFKHDAAEIGEAVAALDRGECVVVFPEGFLRRGDDKPLRRFGRGVWQILQARPDTPVFACWIEGAWGSFCSYRGGPPTKNKKPDVRRPIAVAVAAPVAVDADTLKDHLATRVFLMNRVLAARALLGLPEVPPVVLPAHDADAPEAGTQPA